MFAAQLRGRKRPLYVVMGSRAGIIAWHYRRSDAAEECQRWQTRAGYFRLTVSKERVAVRRPDGAPVLVPTGRPREERFWVARWLWGLPHPRATRDDDRRPEQM